MSQMRERGQDYVHILNTWSHFISILGKVLQHSTCCVMLLDNHVCLFVCLGSSQTRFVPQRVASCRGNCKLYKMNAHILSCFASVQGTCTVAVFVGGTIFE